LRPSDCGEEQLLTDPRPLIHTAEKIILEGFPVRTSHLVHLTAASLLALTIGALSLLSLEGSPATADVSFSKTISLTAMSLSVPAPSFSSLFSANLVQTRSRKVPEEYRTISLALRIARPGDHILIAPGTYRESGLVMESRNRDVVVRGTGASPSEVIIEGNEAEPVVTVKTSGVRLENFTVTKGRRGVRIDEGSSGVTVENMVFDGNLLQGLLIIKAGPDITVKGSQFLNNVSIIKDDGREVGGQGLAVALGSSGGVVIENNRLQGNMGANLYLWKVSDVKASNNLITQAKPHRSGLWGNGVEIFRTTTDILLAGNTIEENYSSGVLIGEAGNPDSKGSATLEGNVIRGNGTDGVQANEEGTHVTLNQNVIVENAACGVRAQNGAVVEGSANTIERNGQQEGCGAPPDL
jgi:hypothetical protein